LENDMNDYPFIFYAIIINKNVY